MAQALLIRLPFINLRLMNFQSVEVPEDQLHFFLQEKFVPFHLRPHLQEEPIQRDYPESVLTNAGFC
jgi:hypothetical protein